MSVAMRWILTAGQGVFEVNRDVGMVEIKQDRTSSRRWHMP